MNEVAEASRRRRGRASSFLRKKIKSVNLAPLRLMRSGERDAKLMRLVDAEDLEFGREELQLLKRQADIARGGMALNVGIELSGLETTLKLIAFELRHVDAVGGEAAHGLVERSGYVPYTKYKRSEEHTSELKSLMRISYAVFCLTKK